MKRSNIPCRKAGICRHKVSDCLEFWHLTSINLAPFLFIIKILNQIIYLGIHFFHPFFCSDPPMVPFRQ